MSRPTYAPKQIYTGTGSLAVYTFNFKIEALAQLLVIEVDAAGVETQRVLGTDAVYLSGVVFDAVEGGGTVTLAANLVTNYNLILLLANDAPTQNFEFRNKTSFTLKRFESALDAILGSNQRLTYRGKQAFRIHDLDDEETFNSQLPAGIAAALNKTLIINPTGTGMEYGPDAATIAAAEGFAVAAGVSAAAALVSELAAAADLVLTNADVVLTGLDVVTTNADVVLTNADVVLTNADVVLTGLDVIAAAASAAAALVSENAAAADLLLTNADVVSTNADVVLTNADVVLTGLDVIAAAASAAAALVSENAAAASAATALAETIQTFATESVTAAAAITHSDAMRQYRRVESATAGAISASLTPFGTSPTNFVDGMEIIVVGTDDTKTVQLSRSDVQYGALINGDLILGKGMSVGLIYDSTLERWISRNYF